MSKYMSEEALKASQENVYELKSIVIHRGGAYGGHYLAYIRDDLGEGNWYLEKHGEYQKEPEVIVQKKFDAKEFMTEKEIKELEDEKNKNNPNKKKNKKNKKKEEKTHEQELDFSKCDFPIPYSEQRLVENWYEFNDSTVTPIYPGVLQSKFGGNSSNGNAYMLVYRHKSLNGMERPKLPEY